MIEILVMALFFTLSMLILARSGVLKSSGGWFCASLLLFLAFALRWKLLPYETLDYQNFLSRWVDFFRENGGFRGLRHSIGNYNVPYLYFLAAFSYTDYSDLYLIKYLSIAFDILLAWAVMGLCSLFRSDAASRLTAFCGTLLLPTVVLNGACWGQCDSIYVALALLSFLCALKGKPKLSLVLISLSFAFKLQAVFFMPVYFLLFVSGRIRWRDMWIVPGSYLLCVLPAVAAGRPLLSTLTLYLDQAGTVGSGLNYNSPSLYAFYRGIGDPSPLSRLGIVAAFSFCFLLLAVLTLRRAGKDNRALLLAFTLTAICVPLLLPHMHDRYFFGADVLCFAAAFLGMELLPLPFLCSFASLLGYHAYLKMRYFLPMHYGSVALLLCALLLTVSLFAPRKKNTGKKKKEA